MSIELEKILTISAKEWFDATGKDPKNYEARGIHDYSNDSYPILSFSKAVPSDAEIVVKYQENIRGFLLTCANAHGTALIPKKK